MKIHSTAIISPDCDIHESVEIGPFTVIEDGVKIEEGTVIEDSVRIRKGASIGKFNVIYHGADIGANPQDLSFDPKIETGIQIGDHNIIRENTIFHRGTIPGGKTIIGNHNYLMGGSHIAHDVKFGNHSIMVQNSVIAGHVVVGDYVFISGLVAIHQHNQVGDYAMIAGLSKVVQDAPPYSTVDGNPCTVIGLNSVGLKRAGISPEVRQQIKSAYKLIYNSKITTKQALEQLKKQENPTKEILYIIQFFENSKRGVTDHR